MTAETTRLFVAPLDAAAALESIDAEVSAFDSMDFGECDPHHVATLHCLLDGVDPSAPAPSMAPVWNPFVAQWMTLTNADVYVDASELFLDGTFRPAARAVQELAESGCTDERYLVFRLPSVLVERVVALEPGARDDLAARWSAAWARRTYADGRNFPPFPAEAARSALETIATMGAAATAGAGVFLRMWR